MIKSYNITPCEVLIFSAMLIDLCKVKTKINLLESIDTCELEYYKNKTSCIVFNIKNSNIKFILDYIADKYNLSCINVEPLNVNEQKIYYTFWYYISNIKVSEKNSYLKNTVNVIIKFITLDKLINTKFILFNDLLFKCCVYIIKMNCNLYYSVITCDWDTNINYFDLSHVSLF